MFEIFVNLSEEDKNEVAAALTNFLATVEKEKLTKEEVLKRAAALSISFDTKDKNNYCNFLFRASMLMTENEYAENNTY